MLSAHFALADTLECLLADVLRLLYFLRKKVALFYLGAHFTDLWVNYFFSKSTH